MQTEQERKQNTEYKRRYCLEHPEYVLRQKERRKLSDYKQRDRVYHHLQRLLNPEKFRQRERLYQHNHPEGLKDRIAKWRLTHKKAYNLSQQLATARRNARLKMATVDKFTKQDWQDIQVAFHNACAYCGKILPLSIDHIIPIFRGGMHSKDNIVPACVSCNSKKGTKTLSEFLLTGGV